MKQAYEKYLQEILIDSDTLQARIAELGAQISDDYAESDKLLLICILKGGVMFLTDLMRHITIPHEIDFLAVSSYGRGGRSATGNVRIDMDLKEGLLAKTCSSSKTSSTVALPCASSWTCFRRVSLPVFTSAHCSTNPAAASSKSP